jgi:biotin synthase-like enzyme
VVERCSRKAQVGGSSPSRGLLRMDKPIIKIPELNNEIKELVKKAEKTYWENFDGEVWFGRCIFLSWFCERGTCKFCFRSVTKKQISNPDNARRGLASILAEALMIRAFNWRIEFLTGGYGILKEEDLVRTVRLVSEIINGEMWLNLGEMGTSLMEEFKPYVDGIISSVETLEPKLHDFVCPDKPIQPYVEMIKKGQKLGFKQGITIIIGLGEKREDFSLLKEFVLNNKIERITIYTLRPVQGTIFEHGPTTEDLLWWIAQTRINFPKLEIIVGSAIYRLGEIGLILQAGANALTKLPATNMFNSPEGKQFEDEIKKVKRNFSGKFNSKDVYHELDWENVLNKTDLSVEEKKQVLETLNNYLVKMDERYKNNLNK